MEWWYNTRPITEGKCHMNLSHRKDSRGELPNTTDILVAWERWDLLCLTLNQLLRSHVSSTALLQSAHFIFPHGLWIVLMRAAHPPPFISASCPDTLLSAQPIVNLISDIRRRLLIRQWFSNKSCVGDYVQPQSVEETKQRISPSCVALFFGNKRQMCCIACIHRSLENTFSLVYERLLTAINCDGNVV